MRLKLKKWEINKWKLFDFNSNQNPSTLFWERKKTLFRVHSTYYYPLRLGLVHSNAMKSQVYSLKTRRDAFAWNPRETVEILSSLAKTEPTGISTTRFPVYHLNATMMVHIIRTFKNNFAEPKKVLVTKIALRK